MKVNSMAMHLDLDKICIVCLQESGDMVSIFDRDDIELTIAEKITKCHPRFNLDELGNRPDKICVLCLDDLAAAYRFQNNCETAILLFRSSLQSEESLREEMNVQLPATNEDKDVQEFNEDLNEEFKQSENDDTVDFREEDIQTENDNYDEFCELEELDYEDEHLKVEYDDPTMGEDNEVQSTELSSLPSPPRRNSHRDNDYTTEGLHDKDSKSGKKRINSKAPKTFSTKPLKKPKEKSTHGPKICDLCGNSYKFQHALNAHMRRHNNDRPFNCECCEKAFISNVELRRHMRVHTGDKPYGCSYCERRFSDYGSRIKHERTHTGERPFVCRTCNKSFAYAHVLSVHLRTHTGEKKFQCPQCGKGFTKKAYMLAHIEQHARSALITIKEEEESQNVYLPYPTDSAHAVQENSEESLEECLTTYIVEEIDGENCDLKVLQEVGTDQESEFILGID